MTTVDSYAETNYGTDGAIEAVHPSASGSASATGQSFSVGSANYRLTSCQFYIAKVNSPVGNLKARVCEHSGTYGSSSTGAGTVLATSDAVAMAGLGAYALVTFSFSGVAQVVLDAKTKYCVYVYANDATTLDATNHFHVGVDVTSPSHGGNFFYFSSSAWTASAISDGCFYVVGSVSPSLNKTASLDKSSSLNKNTSLNKAAVLNK